MSDLKRYVQERKKKDGEFISSEEMDKILDKPIPLWEEIYGWLYRTWNKIIYIPKDIQHFIQRGKRGWADCDVWSLDDYLARVISQSVRSLEKIHHGYPAGPFGHALFSEDTVADKAWSDTLNQIVEGFELMLDLEDYSFKLMDKKVPVTEVLKMETKRRAEAKEKMQLFIKYFEDLWD